MKYEILWLSSKDNHSLYSNYAKNRKELKRKLDYFINELGLKLNDEDRFDNLQVSKKTLRRTWMILSSKEVLKEINEEV